MRCALFTLVKRQVIDNAIYFAVALVVSFVLIFATISAVLTEYHNYLSLYTTFLLFAVPVLFCTGSYMVGLTQSYTDRTSGITAMLSVLPVPPGWMFLARLVVGAIVILAALGPLAIVGAVLWMLLGPPAWLFHNWIGDTFTGLALTAFGCYCLGLHAGGIAGSFTNSLRALPLTFILLLLIFIKGFGWPLLVILVPFVFLSLLRYWKPFTCRFLTNITLGLMVAILLVIPLYVGRNLCDGLFLSLIDAEAKISPSGLLPPEIENDPNVTRHSTAKSTVNLWHWAPSIVRRLLGSHYYDFYRDIDAGPYFLENSGLIQYFESRKRGKRYMYTPSDKQEQRFGLIHLDEVGGRLVCHRKYIDRYYDEYTWQWKDAIELYAGPKGMSITPNQKLGRFGDPVIHFESTTGRFQALPLCVVYDADARCFFAIDFERHRVQRGSKPVYDSIRPADIGSAGKSKIFGVGFRASWDMYKIGLDIASQGNTGYLPLIDESGRIDLLDPNTLELRGPAGHLPNPQTLLGLASSRPTDLLDYDVDIVTIEPASFGRKPISKWAKKQYLGLVVGSLARQGMWSSVAVFDWKGRQIKTAHSKVALFDVPGGPLLTVMKFLFESLHPPVLALASYFTAYSFEARSTHRALFLMPNSFVAMARDYQGNIFWTFLLVLLLMLPGLLFSGVLGWRIMRDAAIYGLSDNARRLWLLGTLTFGLPAYITYRLTKPRITLVTCTNCGKPRRPDMDKCHRCNSPWHVPELAPPAWRVLDGDMVKEAKDDLRIG